MIRRLLIANRGEIAARIARTCRRLGVAFVTVHSEADRDAPHLEGAAARVVVGPAPAARSYLDGPALVRAALETGCDALHPGYGFLSENAGFAAAVEAAGLLFVGPAPTTIEAMGDKAAAKALMAAAGVPVVPGSAEASDDPARIAELVEAAGRPALLKPAAGGGGKGMAVVRQGDGRAAIESAVRTARSAFGDGRVLVERLIERPRHLEVQVFGDGRGGVVHLFERECTLQRRHQKVVEEAPAARISQRLRAALTEAALRGARALGYRNAGTFEFIADADEAFYFLEVNTRLQVEHPVTEEICGLDLVEWQLRIAAGEGLPLRQDQIERCGHAVECRIYAEDASEAFRPAPGRVSALRWPPGVRIEAGVAEGGCVSPHYDPLVAKLVVHGRDRPEAMARMREALTGTVLLGLGSNLGFLAALLARPEVRAGELDTGLIERLLPELTAVRDDEAAMAAAAAAILFERMPQPGARSSPWAGGRGLGDRGALDPSAPGGRLALASNGCRAVALLDPCGTDQAIIRLSCRPDGPARSATRRRADGPASDNPVSSGLVSGSLGERSWTARVGPDYVELCLDGERYLIERTSGRAAEAAPDGAWAAIPGVVTAILTEPGSVVSKGDVLVVVEAMKCENPVLSPCDGRVAAVTCAVGQSVEAGQPLVAFEADAGPAGEAPASR